MFHWETLLSSPRRYRGAIAPEAQNLSGLQSQEPHLQPGRSCLKITNLNAGADIAWLLQNLTGPKEAVWCLIHQIMHYVY